MKAICNLLLIILVECQLSTFATPADIAEPMFTMNPVIGDIALDECPLATTETDKVGCHLSFVLQKLRAKYSNKECTRRKEIFSALENYIGERTFPHHEDVEAFMQNRNARKPCFVDSTGTPCAVAYLMQKSGAEKLVNDILDASHKHDTIDQISQNDALKPALKSWSSSVGMEISDLALIQPGYDNSEDPSDGFDPFDGFTALDCFSGFTKTMVKGKGAVELKYIDVGDLVLTGKGIYEPVYSIDHRNATKEKVFFYQIFLEREEQEQEQDALELSRKHMVFVIGSTNAVPADTLEIGSEIQTLTGPRKIVNKKTITRNGLYNPLTPDGTIVVNGGIIASTYSALTATKDKVIDTNIVQTNWYKISGSGITTTSSTMSHQHLLKSLLQPYQYICTHISFQLCKTDHEKVFISEAAFKFYNFWFNDDHHQESQKYLISTSSRSSIRPVIAAMVFAYIHLQNCFLLFWNYFFLLLLCTTVLATIKYYHQSTALKK